VGERVADPRSNATVSRPEPRPRDDHPVVDTATMELIRCHGPSVRSRAKWVWGSPKMLRVELLNVKADLERELEDFVLNRSRCGPDVHWVSG
jgi:hypothetical protein